MKIRRTMVFVLAALVLSAPLLYSQVTTATISGTVRDSTGAVVPGAQISIHNFETGSKNSVATDSQGRFLVPNLSLGQYEIQATSPGFQTEVRSGIQLTLGQQAVINFTLNPGAVTESVTVQAEAPLVDTTTSTVGTLVNREQIRDLPLNGRDFTQLVLLQPGVVQYREQSREINRGQGTRMSIAGARPNMVTYRLNGLDISDGSGSTPGSATGHSLGVDAIQEFQVLTNTFAAEYGKSAGGVINVVQKAGTNSLHGALFEYLRNSKLDARNFFDQAKPAFKRNQFGASAGGPIRRDKTFFFGSYEALRERLGLTQPSLVPSLAARGGFFGDHSVTPSPATKPFIDAIPLPTPGAPEYPTTGAAYRIDSFSTQANENYLVGKIDHTFSTSDSLSGSYTYDQGTTFGPAPRGGIGMFTADGRSRAQYVTLRETHSFTPSLLNSFNMGFNRSYEVAAHSQIGGPSPANLNWIPGKTNWQSLEVGGIDRIEYNFVDKRSDTAMTLNTWQLSDNLTVIRGRHSFKMGFEAYRFFFRYETEGRAGGSGRYVFLTLEDLVANNVSPRGSLYQAGDPASLGLKPSIFQKMFGMFVQDDIRLTPRLTVNAGLRYEFITLPQDKLPIQGHLAHLTDPQLTITRNVWGENPSLKNFGPRVGFAWDVFGNQKTAVRAGFGLYYDPLTSYYLLPVVQGNPPFRLTRTVDNAPFPNGFNVLINAPQSSALFDLGSTDYSPNQPYRIQYNMGVQHQILPNTLLGVFYVGAQGVHTSQFYLNANTRTPTFLPDGHITFSTSSPTINPKFGVIQYRQWGGHSGYNSLQMVLQKRMSGGLQFQGSYTWSKSLDNGDIFSYSSEGLSTVSLQNIYQPSLERGLSTFDARHNFSLNTTYNLPSGADWKPLPRTIAGGWQVGGILTLTTGHPFTPIVGFDNANIRTRSRGDHLRPDLAPGRDANTIYPQNADHYYDPTAFLLPRSGTLGNLARGTITGPGFADFDLTLKKRFAFYESKILEFRSEVFNLLNRPNFRIPEEEQRTVYNNRGQLVPAAGRLTSTTSSARQIQFSLRLEF